MFAMSSPVHLVCTLLFSWFTLGLSIPSLYWTPITIKSNVNYPAPRRDTTFLYLESTSTTTHTFLLLSGRENNGHILPDIWMLNITLNSSASTGSWTQLPDLPSPLHRFSAIGATLPGFTPMIAAGEGNDRVFYNDAWAWQNQTWKRIAQGGPHTRYGAAGAAIDSTLYLSHGFAGKRYDDTWAVSAGHGASAWTPVRTSDLPDRPFPRCLMGSAAVHWDGQDALAMFGGCGSGGYGPCPASDAWYLRNGQWRQSASPCMGPRMYTSMATLPAARNDSTAWGAGTVVALAGTGWIWGNGQPGEVALWNLPRDAWQRLQVHALGGGDGPSLRDSAAVASTPHSGLAASQGVVMFGGHDLTSKQVLNDLWVLRVADDGTAPAPAPTPLTCPTIFDIRLLHGICMQLSWGFLLPLGVTIARFCRGRPNACWFKWHRALQITGLVIMTIGFIASQFVNAVGRFSAIPHSILGALIFLVGIQQPINAACRPEPAWPKSAARARWENCHKWSGRVAVLLGLINPLLGIVMYETARRAASAWFIVYAIWTVGLLAYWLVATCLGKPGPENPSPFTAAVASRCGHGYDAQAARQILSERGATAHKSDVQPGAALEMQITR